MRQSKLTKAVALMLSLVMVTSVFVGNTLSRYVTSVSSTDNARVAVWGINGKEVTMELFKTDYDLDGKKIAAANQNDDGSYDKIIAPGTGGSSAFSIINFMDTAIAPEVAYQVKIELDDTAVDERIKTNSSIQWKLDNNEWGTWEQLVGSLLLLSGDQSGVKVYEPGTFATAFKDNVEHKISWQWAMDGNNETDTQMGNDALLNDISAKITVRVTAQQVDDLTTNAYLIDGANQIVNLNYVQPITLKSSADFGTFESVIVNGNPLTRDTDYTAVSGSTVITLKTEYLSNLEAGVYTIEIVSSENTATTNFYVVDDLEDNIPMLAANDSWYKGTTKRSTLKTINIVDEASEDIINNADESWPAAVDYAGDGELDDDVMCYVDGDTLTIAGNGSGKIYMNYDSSFAFSDKNKQDYFKNLQNFSYADLLDTSKVFNINSLFYEACSLKTVDVSNWNTDNVSTMRLVFASSSTKMSFTTLDLSNWNTSKVTDMAGMFQYSRDLSSIGNISNWNTDNVTNMSFMFNYCNSIDNLNTSNWDTSKVTAMQFMFNECLELSNLDTSNWDTSNVTSMKAMFQSDGKLAFLDVGNWNTSKVTDMSYMFNFGDERGILKNLDVSGWDTSNVIDLEFMFYGANKLGTLDVRNWNTSKVKNFDHMFAHSRMVLEGGEEALKNWRTDSATNMYGMFHSIQNTVLDVSKFNTSKVTIFGEMFEQCNKLVTIIGLENFDTSKGIGFRDMFNKCYELKELNLSSFDTSKATYGVKVSNNGEQSDSTHWMFNECRKLQKVILGSKFDFNGDGTTKSGYSPAIFPTQNSTYITGADGYWYTEDGTAYTAAEIQALPNPAGTYYAVNPTLN